MRKFTLAILIALFLTPSISIARESKHHFGQCRQLTKQLENYSGVADMARRRNNASWERATEAQMTRLSNRRHRLCPQWGLESRAQQVMAQAREIVKSAAKAAAKYFSGGIY
jgi:hypothetical protein